MSENSTPEERTEMPTERRMSQLRKEGALFISTDIVQLATLVTGVFLLMLLWNWMYFALSITMERAFTMVGKKDDFTIESLFQGFIGLATLVAPPVILLSLGVGVVAALAVLLQTNWNIKEKKIDFKASWLNPINGVKRIVSLQGLVMTLKALLKLAIMLPIGFFALKWRAPEMVSLMHLSVEQIMEYTSGGVLWIFWKIFYVLLAFAIFDYVWGKYQWLRQNKMTKAEVKDERKSVEGDEETKRKIIHKGLQRIAQRIATSVPKAHVVVTNPTHISVALRYDRAHDAAPIVVAKGKGFVALRIREIAKAHQIPIVERKPVARALFESTEVGSTIPRELFKAVAEVLAYVYRLKNPFAVRETAREHGQVG